MTGGVTSGLRVMVTKIKAPYPNSDSDATPTWPGRLRKYTNLLLNIHFAITNSILKIRYSKYPLILTFV